MKVIAEFVDARTSKRYLPGEGHLIEPALTPAQIVRLTKAGCLEDGSDVEIVDLVEPPVDLSAFTVSELQQYAADNSIDLGDAKKRADIVAAIDLHLEAK
jgi:hypothetical protein